MNEYGIQRIQSNCEEMQKLLEQNPNRNIAVLRTDIDKCQIREKGTRKVIYEGDTRETLYKLTKLLCPTLIEDNFKRVIDIANKYPESTIRIEKVEEDFCRLHIPIGSYTFCLNKNIDEEIEDIKKMYDKEQKQ